MENLKNLEHDNKGLNFNNVAEIGEYLIKEHIEDEPYLSEKILVSHEMVELFLKATGDENEIHQTEEGVRKSVFAEKHPGKLITPGFLTESLLANKKILWKALTINEPHETLNISCSTKWTASVPVGSELFYTFKIKRVKKMSGSPDSDIKVDWTMVDFDTKAYYLSDTDEKIQCMEASYMVGYVPLEKT